MNYRGWRIPHNCLPLSFLVLVACLPPALQAQDDSVTTTVVSQFVTTRIPPTSPDAVPASPVNYNCKFYENGIIIIETVISLRLLVMLQLLGMQTKRYA